MKIIQKTKDLYKKYLFKFFEKNEKFNSFSTLEQSKYIANKIVLVITASSGIGLLLLIFAKTDQIIIVQGELQPISRVRDIKIPISGVVEKIFVQDGDYVDKKQRLLKLDDNLSKETSQNIIKKINLKNNELKFKNIEFKDSIKIIINEITNLKNVIEIEENSLKRFDFLLKEGALSKYDYDEQKIKIIDLKSKLISKKAFKNVRENQLKQQIKLIENDIINLKNELENVNEKLKYSYVTSPINGYIFDLKAKDKGFVLNPNTEIMRIVPDNDLEAIVNINSRDIGFVDLGRRAEIGIDSYPSSDFGVLNGTLTFISQNSSTISSNNNNLFFKAKVSLENQYLKSVSGKKLPLKPGMTITANIKLRRLSYLQILFNLFTDKAKSIKEI
jgi:HlyD family secretion protein